MTPMNIPTDLVISGTLYPQGMVLPANTVTDVSVQPGAAIQATKLQHQHRAMYAQGSATVAAAATQVIETIYGTSGTIVAFQAGAVVANAGAAVCTVDLKKNGVSVLAAPITLNNTQTNRQMVSATVTTVAVAAGDVLEVVITATAGGGTLAQGLFAAATINEMPS